MGREEKPMERRGVTEAPGVGFTGASAICTKHLPELSTEDKDGDIYLFAPHPTAWGLQWELLLPAFLGCTCLQA